jgi:hypothetical protein
VVEPVETYCSTSEVCDARVERVGLGEGVDAVTQAGKVCVGVGR